MEGCLDGLLPSIISNLPEKLYWEYVKMTENKNNIITTTSGIELVIRPVSITVMEGFNSRVRKELEEKGEAVAIPTYELPTAGGGVEVLEHNETTLETDEDKKAWQEYIEYEQKISALATERTNNYVLLEGIDIELPEDESWVMKQVEYYGMEVPDNPVERKKHWLTTEILKTPADLVNVFSKILRLSYDGLAEEDIESAEDSFKAFFRVGRKENTAEQNKEVTGEQE